MKQKIIMILGVQRSGTTALFDTLETANVTAYQEVEQSTIYDDFFLRPEPEIRFLLRSSTLPILLKPVRESERRGVLEILSEFSDYDVHIVWAYRDPVNVIYSYEREGWTNAVGYETVASEWVSRNEALLNELNHCRSRVDVVRYEDLLNDPMLIHVLASRLGLRVQSTLDSDSRGGRSKMDPVFQAKIDSITSKTLHRLDQVRLTDAETAPASDASGTCSILRSQQQSKSFVHRLFERAVGRVVKAGPDSTSVIVDALAPVATSGPRRAMEPFHSRVEYYRDPYGCFRRWRELGSVQYLALQDRWLVLDYDDVSNVLTNAIEVPDCVRLWFNVSRVDDAPEFVARQAELTHYLEAPTGRQWLESCDAQILRNLSAFRDRGAFDWVEFSSAISRTLNASLLGTLPETGGQDAKLNSFQPEDTEEQNDDARGLLNHLVEVNWTESDLNEVQAVSSHFCAQFSEFLSNMISTLLLQPNWRNMVRDDPTRSARIVAELIRLAPPFPIHLITLANAIDLRTASIPAASSVYIAIGSANRDTTIFPDPDSVRLDRTGPGALTFGDGKISHFGLREQVITTIATSLVRILAAEFTPLSLVSNPFQRRYLVDQAYGVYPRELMVTFA